MGFMQDFTQAFSPAYLQGQQALTQQQQIDIERAKLALQQQQWGAQKPLYEADATLKSLQGQAITKKMQMEEMFRNLMMGGGPAGGPVAPASPAGGISPQQPQPPGTLPQGVSDLVNYWGKNYGLTPEQIAILPKIISVESKGNQWALNKSNANGTDDFGVMQVNSSNLPAFLKPGENIFDPTVNIRIGTEIFSNALKQSGGDIRGALGAYNTGRVNPNAPYVGRVLGPTQLAANGGTASDAPAGYGVQGAPQPAGDSTLPEWYRNPTKRAQVYALASGGYEPAVNAVKLLETQTKIAEHESPNTKRENDLRYDLKKKEAEKRMNNPDGSFQGNSTEGQSWNFVNAIAPKIADGTASEAERRLYMASEAHLTAPRVNTDPQTGATSIVQLDLGAFGLPSLKKSTQPPQGQSQSQPGQNTGYTTTSISAPKVPDDVRKSIIAIDDLLSGINSLTLEMNGGGVIDNKIPFTERKGRLGSAYTLLQMRMKEASNLGVLNGPDLGILQKALQDPTSMTSGWSQDSMRGGLDVVRDMFAKKRQALISGNPGAERTSVLNAPAVTAPAASQADLIKKYGLEN